MNISILTLFPELYKPFLQTSLLKRAQEKDLVSYDLQNLFDYVEPKQRIDAPTFGHDAGMLIRPDVVQSAVEDVERSYGKAFKIVLSPQGKKLNQRIVKKLWNAVKDHNHLLLLASRYEGIDARVEQHYADEVISVGDFVTMGGDVPAMLLMEALLRYMPGVVGQEQSVEQDSFSSAFVDYPEYTKPVVWQGIEVPEVLRSGDHKAIATWRKHKAAEVTVKKHFDWMRSSHLSQEDKKLAQQYIPNHYAALMHDEIVLKEGRIGTTSVTSIDVHDIARSCATYDLKNFFVVTPLKDQQNLVRTITDFWQDYQIGGEYNKNRHQAIHRVRLQESLDCVIEQIEQQEGKKPLIIGTSARMEKERSITYHDQELVWQHYRPVLFLFGTGHGMAESLLDRCDFMLLPVQGFSDFNHLSVRSAAAIIFDKWLGLSRRLRS